MSHDEPCLYAFPGREHWHDGIRHWPHVTLEAYEAFKEFQVVDGDVIVCGYPRSGNMWLVSIIRAIFSQDSLANFKETAKFDNELFLEANAKMARKSTNPDVFHCHVYHGSLPKDVYVKKPKIIYIMRNPKDVAISFYNFHRILTPTGPWSGTWEVFFEAFMKGEVFNGSWLDHARGFLARRNDPNLLILTYEELKEDPRKMIKMIGNFLDKPLSGDMLEQIVEMTSFDVTKEHPLNPSFDSAHWLLIPGGEFMRSGQIGRWRDILTKGQSDAMDSLLNTVREEYNIDLEEN